MNGGLIDTCITFREEERTLNQLLLAFSYAKLGGFEKNSRRLQ